MDLTSQGQSISKDPSTTGFDLTAGHNWIYPQDYPVRDYQLNIVSNALYDNTLVCLPTGLGKTFIAAVVMYNFWRWYPHGKVVFLAPTRPLVAQQIGACHDIMKIPRDQTQELTGQMNPKKRQIAWLKKRVIFATPQVFQNDLEKNIAPGELVKCVVVDEAHKALGKHSYCESLRILGTQNKYFRVLGLSATPGSKLEDVRQVIQNLYISHLELRDETSTDIVPYLNKREMEIILVDLDDDLAKFKERYIHIMDRHVKMLIKYNVIKGEYTSNISKGKIHYLKQEYQGRQIKAANHNHIMNTLNICQSMFHAYELMIRHGLRAYYNFYQNHSKDYYWMKNEPLLRALLEEVGSFLGPFPDIHLLPDGSVPEIPENIVFGHTKFHKLRELLLRHFTKFQEQKKETRAIVFVEYRDSVNEVYVLLLQSRPLLRPQMFVGQAGQKQRQQMKAMDQFKSNKVNVLISTSVGEEGLDVGEVDLIVCFDISQRSPIRLVQRMGRTGRKRDGHIIMLVTDGKEHQILKSTIARRDSLNNKVLKSSNIVSSLYQESPRMVPPVFMPECRMHRFIVQLKTPAKESKKAEQSKTMKASPSKGNKKTGGKANSKKLAPQTDGDKAKGSQSSMLRFFKKANSDGNPSAISPSCSPEIHELRFITPKADNVKLLTSDDAAIEFLTLWVMRKTEAEAMHNKSDRIDLSYFPKRSMGDLDNISNYRVPSLDVLECLDTLEKEEEEETSLKTLEDDDGFYDDVHDHLDMPFNEINLGRQPEDEELEVQESNFEDLLNDSYEWDQTMFLEDEENPNADPGLEKSRFEAMLSEDSNDSARSVENDDDYLAIPGKFEALLDRLSDESSVERSDSEANNNVNVLNERLNDNVEASDWFEDHLSDSSKHSTGEIDYHEKYVNEPSTQFLRSPVLSSFVSQNSNNNKKEKFVETMKPLEESGNLDDDRSSPEIKKLSLNRSNNNAAMKVENRKIETASCFESFLNDSSKHSTGEIDYLEKYVNEPSTSRMRSPVLSSVSQTCNIKKKKLIEIMNPLEKNGNSYDEQPSVKIQKLSLNRLNDNTAIKTKNSKAGTAYWFGNLPSDSSKHSTSEIDAYEKYVNEPSTSHIRSPVSTSSVSQTCKDKKKKFVEIMNPLEKSGNLYNESPSAKIRKLSLNRLNDKSAMVIEDRKIETAVNEPSTSHANNNRSLNHIRSPVLMSTISQTCTSKKKESVKIANSLERNGSLRNNQTAVIKNMLSSNNSSVRHGTDSIASQYFNSETSPQIAPHSKPGNGAKLRLSKLFAASDSERSLSSSLSMGSEEIHSSTENQRVGEQRFSAGKKFSNQAENTGNDNLLSVTQMIDFVENYDAQKGSSALTNSSSNPNKSHETIARAGEEMRVGSPGADRSTSANCSDVKYVTEKSSEDDIFNDELDLSGIQWDEEFEQRNSNVTDTEKSRNSAKPEKTDITPLICIDLTDDENEAKTSDREPVICIDLTDNEVEAKTIGAESKFDVAEKMDPVSSLVQGIGLDLGDYDWDSDFESPSNPVESEKYFQANANSQLASKDTSGTSSSKRPKLAVLRNWSNSSMMKNHTSKPGSSDPNVAKTDTEKLKDLEKTFFDRGNGNNPEAHYALTSDDSPVRSRRFQLSLRDKENALPNITVEGLSAFAAPNKYRRGKNELTGREKAAGKEKLVRSADRLVAGGKRNGKSRRRDKMQSEFFDRETEVASDADTTDGSSGSDADLENFVSYTQEVPETVDMRAHYLQSVRSPLKRPGGFLFRKQKSPEPDIDIYSQPQNFEEPSEYFNDSFCVDVDEDDDAEDTHNYSLLERAERKLKKRRRRRSDDIGEETCKKRKVVEVHSDDSSSEDETEILRRQILDESMQLKNKRN